MSSSDSAGRARPPPGEQDSAIKRSEDAELKEHEEWYVLSSRWWNLFQDYLKARCGENMSDEVKEGVLARQNSGTISGGHPPPIDNSGLIDGDLNQIRKGLVEQQDFVLLPREAWALLHEWYGGGPVLKRKVIAAGVGSARTLRVELYPFCVSLYQVDDAGIPNSETKFDAMFSRSATVKDVIDDPCLKDVFESVSSRMTLAESICLWHRSDVDVDQADIESLTGWQQLQPLSSTLEDLEVVDGATFIVERCIVQGNDVDKAKWPFFRRLRLDYKSQNYKDPMKSDTHLTVDDMVDASDVDPPEEAVEKDSTDATSKDFGPGDYVLINHKSDIKIHVGQRGTVLHIDDNGMIAVSRNGNKNYYKKEWLDMSKKAVVKEIPDGTMCGTWSYGEDRKASYKISERAGGLTFTENSSEWHLEKEGEWYVGELNGGHLRLKAIKNGIVSEYKPRGATEFNAINTAQQYADDGNTSCDTFGFTFKIGDKVEMRDNFSTNWQTGIVTSVDPLMVRHLTAAIGYKWDKVRKKVSWYAATVLEESDMQILLQFHNREKPEVRDVPELTAREPKGEITVGELYEARRSDYMDWKKVIISKANGDGTYGAIVQGGVMQDEWDRVADKNIRNLTTLKPVAEVALTKVFNRYASNGEIDRGPLRGMLSCATNQMIEENDHRIGQFLKEPYGNGEIVKIDGFLHYWTEQLSNGAKQFQWEQLQRLFQRAGADQDFLSDSDRMLQKGQEWIDRNSKRLAQYRSKTEPTWGMHNKNWRDFRRFDKIDAKFGQKWRQGEIESVDWELMAVLVKVKDDPSNYNSPSQKEWIPMESERLAEHETQSLIEEDDEAAVTMPLLVRTRSRGGKCEVPGACGLNNLGNTCFMNSTIQCLSNTPPLREFFAGSPNMAPPYVDQICTSPMSMGGRLAKTFSLLLRDIWSSEKHELRPAQLKKIIGEKRPEFTGFQQHDAHELLAFLLDGLHEDTNRAPYPYETVEDKDDPERPDEEIAKEQWARYQKRNDSQIVDLFQFQVRSELECPVTGAISVTFDPTMYFSIPVPKPPHSVPFLVLPANFPEEPKCELRAEVPDDITFKQLEAETFKMLGRTPSERNSTFSFVDLLGDRVYSFFSCDARLNTIKQNDDVVAIEVLLEPGVPEEDHTFVPVVFRWRTMTTGYYWSSQQYTWEKAAPPRVIAIPKGCTNAKLCSSLQGMAEKMLKEASQSQPWRLRFSWGTSFGQTDGDEIYANGSECRRPMTTAYSTDKPTLWVDFQEPEHGRCLKDRLLPTVNKNRSYGGGGGSSAKERTTLGACLAKNNEREQLSEEDSVYCRRCKEFRPQFKTLSIWRGPEILIVHLRRFGRESRNAPLKKIETAVEYPDELDLAPYMSPASVDTNTKYDLYAVINHMGGCSGGHYTAFAKITPPAADRGGDWYEFNDSRVTRQQNAPSTSTLNQEHAYVLFYRRRS